MKSKIKASIFIIIFCVLFNLIMRILWILPTPISEFYKERNDTMDIMYIGSSNVYMHFNSTLAYDKYGFTTGIFALGAIPFMTSKYMIEETLKYQNPKLFIIDLSTVATDSKIVFTENNVRNVTNSFKKSNNRINLLNEMQNKLKENKIKTDEKYTFYYPFLLYHNSWKSLNQEKFTKSNNYFKGYYLSNEQIKNISYSDLKWDNDVEELQKYNSKVLIDTLNYLKEKNLNVIFTVPIRNYDLHDKRKINRAIEIIESYGYDVINFNNIETKIVNFKTDLFNWGHLNVYGATKFTLYFSKYLKENYDLPDHRNDKKYLSWNNEYDRFKKLYKELTKNDFDDLLQKSEN